MAKITWAQYLAGRFAKGTFTMEFNGSMVEVTYAPHFSGGCSIEVDGCTDDVHPSIYGSVLDHIGVDN